ncbi:MAG TPA: hypothetical protein VIC84_12585 [Blastocatellia bacterium]|jgi:hypothetical protein
MRFLADLLLVNRDEHACVLGGDGDLSVYQFGIGASGACHTNINTTAVGEVASWTLRQFDAPVPTVYARAQIENTVLEVGAIGPAAEEI